MPGRSYSASGYRYGFNGKEKDDEVKGSGNSIDFGARIHDPRLGRFLSTDPRMREFPYLSPYAFAVNNPIYYIDENGEGPGIILGGPALNQGAILIFKVVTSQDVQEKATEVSTSVGKAAEKTVGYAMMLDGAQKMFAGGSTAMRAGPLAEIPLAYATVGALEFAVGAIINYFTTPNDNQSAGNNSGETSQKNTTSNEGETKTQQNTSTANKGTSGGERSGKDFTKAGKREVIEANKAQNGGTTTCQNCKTQTVPAQQSQRGVTPPKNETQVDHIIAKSKGGDGAPSNGQVLCRGCNILKSDD